VVDVVSGDRHAGLFHEDGEDHELLHCFHVVGLGLGLRSRQVTHYATTPARAGRFDL
jgi:hypothetical protein